ncbi:hypothetical protein ACVIQY_003326 [Bradyrhizobium sp. USDA 3051]
MASMTPPQLPAVVERARLTAALRRGGVLDAGAVREVKVLHQYPAMVSHVIRLGLRYVGEAAGSPHSVILKIPNPAYAKSLANSGRQEVAFYTRLAPNMPSHIVRALLRWAFRRGEPGLASAARRSHRQP